VDAMGKGDVMILEKTRLYKGDAKDDPELGRERCQIDGSLRE